MTEELRTMNLPITGSYENIQILDQKILDRNHIPHPYNQMRSSPNCGQFEISLIVCSLSPVLSLDTSTRLLLHSVGVNGKDDIIRTTSLRPHFYEQH